MVRTRTVHDFNSRVAKQNKTKKKKKKLKKLGESYTLVAFNHSKADRNSDCVACLCSRKNSCLTFAVLRIDRPCSHIGKLILMSEVERETKKEITLAAAIRGHRCSHNEWRFVRCDLFI
ncbi:hypothetical protein ACKS23_02865 [Histoplasma ohiense]